MIVGIGTDLVDLGRFRATLDRTPRLVERVFTDREREYCLARRDPTERFAGRFAAKEAVLKAMGKGIFSFSLRQIEVARDDETGAPSLVLHEQAGARAGEIGVEDWRLTISHTDDVAQAIAVALAQPDVPSLRLALPVSDLARSVDFYERALGFTVVGRDEGSARLRLGTVDLALSGSADAPTAEGGAELIIEVPDVRRAHRRAREVVDDVAVPDGPRDGADAFGLVDPDGVRIRVSARVS